MGEIVTVEFHGDRLLAERRSEGEFVALKPIVGALGMNWSGQFLRLKRDPILSEGICMTQTPSRGGAQEAVALRLDLLNGWLFTIDANRVRPAIRDKVILYQRECYAALYAHFHPPAPAAAELPPSMANDQGMSVLERKQLVTEARLSFGPQAGRQMWKALGLPLTPAMLIQNEAPQARQALLRAMQGQAMTVPPEHLVGWLVGEGYGEQVAKAAVDSLEKEGVFRRVRSNLGDDYIYRGGGLQAMGGVQ